MPDTDGLLRALNRDVNVLRDAVRSLAEALRRSRVTTVLLAVTVTVTVVLGVAVGYIALRTRSNLHCVQAWANASSARTAALANLSVSRQDALDDLLRDVVATNPSQPEIALAVTHYLTVSNEYKMKTKANPPKSLPSFDCSGL